MKDVKKIFGIILISPLIFLFMLWAYFVLHLMLTDIATLLESIGVLVIGIIIAVGAHYGIKFLKE